MTAQRIWHQYQNYLKHTQVFSPTGFINSTREQTTETLRLKTMSTKNYSMNSVHKVGTKSETAKCSQQIKNTFLIRVVNEPVYLECSCYRVSSIAIFWVSERTIQRLNLWEKLKKNMWKNKLRRLVRFYPHFENIIVLFS